MTARARDYFLLAVLAIVLAVVVVHYYPTIMAAETGQGLPR